MESCPSLSVIYIIIVSVSIIFKSKEEVLLAAVTPEPVQLADPAVLVALADDGDEVVLTEPELVLVVSLEV